MWRDDALWHYRRPMRATPRETSFRMSRVRHFGTEPELRIRRGLRSLRVSFRLHVASLPGTPDIVIPKARTVLQVHGCFWHGHHCNRGQLPATNRPYWRAKVERNRVRDRKTARALRKLGWRVLT